MVILTAMPLGTVVKSSPLNNKAKGKLFYGWIAALVGMALVFSAANIQYIFGVFVKPLADDFGWSRAAISGCVSGRSIVSCLCAPFVGSWSDKYGPRKFILFGVVLVGLSYLLAARTNSIWELYLSLSILTGIGTTSAFIPVVATVTRWFGGKAALGNGIVMTGFGIAQIILPPIETFIIIRYGWPASFIFLAIVVWIVGIIAWHYFKSPPSATSKPTAKEMKAGGASPASDFTILQALRIPIFWVMLVINLVAFLAYQMSVIHVVPAAIQTGASPEAAALILTLGGAGSTCGRLGMGALASRWGTKRVLVFCLACQIVALSLLTVARDLSTFFTSATLLGFSYGGVIPIMPTMAGGYFGLSAMGSIFSVINIAQNIGAAIGPLAAGFVFDITASYYLAFLSAAILMAIAFIISLFLKPPRKKATTT